MEVHGDWKCNGGPAEVETFLADLKARLPANWSVGDSREFGYGRKALAIDYERDGDEKLPAARVILVLRTGEAKVATITPTGDGAGTLDMQQCNALLAEWQTHADAAVEGKDLVVERWSSETHIRRWLSPEADGLLRSFSSSANRSTGSGHPSDEKVWLAFILQAHRDNSTLVGQTLEQFLVDEENWDGEMAHRLARQYDWARRVLMYADEN
jgi:hypothetical protein